MSDRLQEAMEAVRGARRIAVLTGAGMSADSGVPTFRDACTGLWERFDVQQLATREAFRANPALVFGWYTARARTVQGVEPHAGYAALVRLQQLFDSSPVVTQNVDGLHSRAGSLQVIELHGSLMAFRCFDCGQPFPLEAVLALAWDAASEGVPPPPCTVCEGPVRPGVVWFGEMLPADALAQAGRAVDEAEAVLVIGTSSVVYPAAEFPRRAKRAGARVVEINPERTEFSSAADVYWDARASEALPALADGLLELESTV